MTLDKKFVHGLNSIYRIIGEHGNACFDIATVGALHILACCRDEPLVHSSRRRWPAIETQDGAADTRDSSRSLLRNAAATRRWPNWCPWEGPEVHWHWSDHAQFLWRKMGAMMLMEPGHTLKAVLGGVVAFQPLAPLPGRCARMPLLPSPARRNSCTRMPLLPSPARHNSYSREPPRNGRRHAALTQSLAVDSKDAASAIGYVIGAGSVLLYTPMIFRVARRKCAAGLSPSTWLLKLGCYFVTDIYNLSHGYPLSSFAETITLFFQALVMLLLVCYFERLSVCIRFLYPPSPLPVQHLTITAC